MNTLKKIAIRAHKVADYQPEDKGKIPILKKNAYCVVEGYSIGGEAPKSFIRVYEYQYLGRQKKVKRNLRKQRKSNISSWTLYIAKAGHKWYPIESITEHLIARIGSVLGLNMAHSRLAQMDNQIRFLSKYFIDHDADQELVHGTDILASYVGDRPFIQEIQQKKLESDFFSLETVVDAVTQLFPSNYTKILENYFLMLVFDAWVGVQDRHFDNWAVVRSIYGKHAPYFSPIYDSARGLFWNEKEEKIKNWHQYKQINTQIEKQIRHSLPQVGLNACGKVNHFQLVEEILSDRFLPIKSKAASIFNEESLLSVRKMIRNEFDGLLSNIRINLIINCLEIRFQTLTNFL